MQVSRQHVWNSMMVSLLTTFNNNHNYDDNHHQQSSDHSMMVPNLVKKTSVYHQPPKGVSYDDNGTVFGEILRGESPARILDETEHAISFLDIHPKAPLHGLVIPKKLIGSVFDLTTDDLPLLYEMKAIAESVLRHYDIDAFRKGDYRLCFHIPPYNSVNHLHLHILAPLSAMKTLHRKVIYDTSSRRAADLSDVLRRLKDGEPAVPYKRPQTRLVVHS